MTFDELKEMVSKDLRIDENHLDRTAAMVPILYTKYLNMLQDEQVRVSFYKAKYKKIYRDKYTYYRNDYEVLLKNKSEIDVMIDGDSEVQEARTKYEYHLMIANYLENVLKQISGLSFLIRDMIEWKKFQAGS